MTVFNRVGPYEIEQEIGRGGMAVVLLARDTRTGERLALKLVREGLDREAQDILDAEQRGAHLQRQFSALSSRVPRVFEFGLDSGYFYVAMEYLEGENLSDAIARGPMPAERALTIAVELCRFVEDAHGFEPEGDRPLRSLLHGDLKPRNIRLTPDGQVKVLDFGIAKALSMSRRVTRNDFGSVAYLSPERLESGDVDQHADYWAIGVLLYEMLTGEQAYRASDTRRLERLILGRCPPARVATLEPARARAVIAKLLGPVPADRYSSAREIREDLERCARDEATVAERDGWPRIVRDEPATRRTHGPAVDQEATRRTTKALTPVPALPSAALAPVVVPPIPMPAVVASRSHPSRASRALRWVAGLVAVIVVINQLLVSSAAARVAEAIDTTELGELPQLWNQYDELSRRSYFGFTTRRLARRLTGHTRTLADRVIANYRTPMPTVREAQWRQAQTALMRALSADPDDRGLRAALRYCEGHLHRIDGEARKARRLAADAQREFAEAVSAFREAAELRSDWADPYLGLMRTFIYGLDDVDRAADALQRAERAGYRSGTREAAQFGDGYRARGDGFVRSARDVAGLDQEREYLTRAADSYRQALDHYARAADFSGVSRSVAMAQRGLATAERRLALLTASPLDSLEHYIPWR
jgi:serine/threonine protein kinase